MISLKVDTKKTLNFKGIHKKKKKLCGMRIISFISSSQQCDWLTVKLLVLTSWLHHIFYFIILSPFSSLFFQLTFMMICFYDNAEIQNPDWNTVRNKEAIKNVKTRERERERERRVDWGKGTPYVVFYFLQSSFTPPLSSSPISSSSSSYY